MFRLNTYFELLKLTIYFLKLKSKKFLFCFIEHNNSNRVSSHYTLMYYENRFLSLLSRYPVQGVNVVVVSRILCSFSVHCKSGPDLNSHLTRLR